MTTPVLPTPDADVRRARALARVLDTVVGIPGTPLRIGVDAILGIIPGAGDVLGAALSGYIVLTAAKRGVSPAVLWRMVANVAIDTAIGAIPVLGDLFDVAWKSNTKNVELLERYISSPEKATTKSRGLGILVVVVVLLVLIGLGTLAFMVTRALWRILTGP
jgi:hypothetical protein